MYLELSINLINLYGVIKMKILNKALSICLSLFICTTTVYADPLDFGVFGGISEGRKLPKTTEQLLATNKNTKKC